MENTNWFSCHVSFPARDDPTSLPKSSFPTTKNGMCNLLSIVFHVFLAKQMTAQWWSQFFRTLFTYMYIYFTRPTKKHGLSNMFRWNPQSLKVFCETRLRWSTQRAASSLAIHDFQKWWLMMVDELFSCFVYSVGRYSHVRCVYIVYIIYMWYM